jgi:hypothetical protein
VTARAVFVVTQDVRHLAAWTQDSPRHQTSDVGTTGAWRPLCGERVRDWTATCYGPDFPYRDTTIVRRAMSRPVCRPCLKTLASLTQIGALS